MARYLLVAFAVHVYAITCISLVRSNPVVNSDCSIYTPIQTLKTSLVVTAEVSVSKQIHVQL